MEKSDIVTYKDSTQVARKGKLVTSKDGGSSDILMIIAVKVTLVGALSIWIIKPANTNIAN